MRFVLSIFLLVVFLFSSASRFGVILSFKLNQRYIAKNLCENRFKPKSSCEGKCYLAKQLKKHDQEESKSQKSNPRTEEYINAELSSFDMGTGLWLEKDTLNSFYLQTVLASFVGEIFHPPLSLS
ncbi:MAG: hypothetical protein SFY32_11380 [Bacteroidota bacterium]|nr:hypothetical protein [Bacteroidota bacterium]